MLELKNISKKYIIGPHTINALSDINITIEAGEFVAIMGSSGSGKSTLLNIIGLLDIADTGSYCINGKESITLSENELSALRLKSIGFVFQQFNLLNKFSAFENVCLPLIYAHSSNNAQSNENYAHELLSMIGLENRKEHFPNELSGGQQQRVAIARSLINRPLMILADEPTGNLDSQSEVEILKLFKNLNEQGITIVVVTHDEEVASVANRVVRMKDGKIHSDIRREELISIETQPPTSEINTNKNLTFNYFNYFLLFLRQSIMTLQRGKLRAFLSMLGILIGVGSVIAMLAIGNGAQKSIQTEFANLGTKVLVLKNGAYNPSAKTAPPKLNLEDGDFLKENISYISKTSPIIKGSRQVTFKNKNVNTQIIGTGLNFEKIRNSTPLYGRFFNTSENEQRARVAVIGNSVYRHLFKGMNPIGEMIKIDKIIFQVIGILPIKGSDGQNDRDDVVIIPINTAMHRLLAQNYVDSFDIEITRQSKMAEVEKKVKDLISERHRLPISLKATAFEVKDMAAILKAMNKSNQTMYFLLSAIAGISLVVGGIGIMNVMLASISERTREIGLRKAVGAQSRDILIQFLFEAILITMIGGAAGIFLGIGVAYIISFILKWPVHISTASIFVSLFFAVCIGTIFGFFPAKKAAALHPILALRSSN
jgi:macrolide transport system ATP-binding/permease protein